MSTEIEQGDEARYEGIFSVIGPPGCGKTTWLGSQVKTIVQHFSSPIQQQLYPAPVMVCSLTRTAAQEVVRRGLPIPGKCIGTLHAHAYRALGCPKIAESREHVSDWNERYPEHALPACDGGEPSGEDEADWDREASTDAIKIFNSIGLLRQRCVARESWPIHAREFDDAWSKWKDERGLFDFSDLIDIAEKEVPRAPTAPRVILADEAQDMSALEFSLIRKWGEAAGALIVVGDPWQSLYCWRGAHPDLFYDPAISEDHRRTLGQSYRVPRLVRNAAIAWARRLSSYREIQYHARRVDPKDKTSAEIDGSIRTLHGNWRTPGSIVNDARAQIDKGRSAMILASCSYMLAPLITRLRELGLPFANPWRRRRGDWNPLNPASGVPMSRRVASFLRLDRSTFGDESRPWLLRELSDWVAPLKGRGLLNGVQDTKDAIAAAAKDTPDELWNDQQSAEWFLPDAWDDLLDLFMREGRTTNAPLLAWFKERLSAQYAKAIDYPCKVLDLNGIAALTKEPRLFIGTIHSFKGAEADVVYVLPDVSPAGVKEWQAGGEARDSVIRLFYVAMTRAKEELVLCSGAGEAAVSLGSLIEESA